MQSFLRSRIFVCAFALLSCGAACVAAENPSIKLRQVAMIDIAGRPGFDKVAFANGNLVIAHPGAGTVDVFNPAKRRFIKHLPGIAAARGIAVDDATKTVFIADQTGKSIAVVSAEDWTVKRTIALPIGPQDMVFVPKLNALFVSTDMHPDIYYVAVDGSAAPSKIEIGGRVDGLAYDAAGNRVLASVNNIDQLAVLGVNGAQTKVDARWRINASQPTGLAIDARDGVLFVAVRFAVLALDLAKGTEISRVPAAAGTDTLVFTAAANMLYAGATDGTVTAISVNKGALLAQSELKTDVKGHSFAIDDQKQLIYLPGGREGRSKLVVLRPFSMHPEADADADEAEAPAPPPASQSAPKP